MSAETVFVPLIRHCCTDPTGPEAEAHIQEIKVRTHAPQHPTASSLILILILVLVNLLSNFFTLFSGAHSILYTHTLHTAEPVTAYHYDDVIHMTESATLLNILSSCTRTAFLTALCLQEIVSKGYAQAFWTAYREIIRKKLGLKLVEEVRSSDLHATLSAPVYRAIAACLLVSKV
jgi:hypothetical protein